MAFYCILVQCCNPKTPTIWRFELVMPYSSATSPVLLLSLVNHTLAPCQSVIRIDDVESQWENWNSTPSHPKTSWESGPHRQTGPTMLKGCQHWKWERVCYLCFPHAYLQKWWKSSLLPKNFEAPKSRGLHGCGCCSKIGTDSAN